MRGPWPATHTGGRPLPGASSGRPIRPVPPSAMRPVSSSERRSRSTSSSTLTGRSNGYPNGVRLSASPEPMPRMNPPGIRSLSDSDSRARSAAPRRVAVGDRDPVRQVGHRADLHAVHERVVEGVGVGGHRRQRRVGPQAGVEHAEDVVRRPVRVEPDLVVQRQHLLGAGERELRRQRHARPASALTSRSSARRPGRTPRRWPSRSLT